jgi:thiol-disulfide isomerase/thioredoxin
MIGRFSERAGGIAFLLAGLIGFAGARVGPAAAAGTVAVTIGATTAESTGWDESMGLQAFREDSVDPDARLFDSPDYQQQLLVPGPGEECFLLLLKDRTVRRLPAGALAWSKGDRPSPDPTQGEAVGEFTLLSGIVEFEAGDAHWSIRPQPALVGVVTAESLRKEKPEYFHAAAKYVPDAAAVKTLRAVQGETKIIAFFGTWCLICKHYLPHLLKTMEAAANAKISVEYVGVTEDHAEPAEILKKYQVDTTPVFVVLQGGREIGRITEEPDDSVEKDLALILGGR